ncbi:MAG: serine/threonine protein kinase [Proteobacteria bacterium]|nr:serine/threonine protein kinase [Pseudomonadota bacterium]
MPTVLTPPTTPGLLVPGQMVGEYQVTSVLGRGGMGVVYAGIQPLIGKRVAIKVLQPRYSASEEGLARFTGEARAVNQARSRFIVDIFSFGRLEDGCAYCVMELIDGRSLRAVLEAAAPLPLDYGLAVLYGIARGLEAAHGVGIVHRDLKPENIMVLEESDGAVSGKLLDFGIAKLQDPGLHAGWETQAGAAIGTPHYMSPEQCRGAAVTPAADLYSLGVVMFEMFSGRLPFVADSFVQLAIQHFEAPPPRLGEYRPGIPPALEQLVSRCLSKRPEDRPPTVLALRAELRNLALATQQDAGPAAPLWPQRVRSLVRDSQGGAAEGAAAPAPITAPGHAPLAAAERAHLQVATPGRRWRWLALGLTATALLALAASFGLRAARGPALGAPAVLGAAPAPAAPAARVASTVAVASGAPTAAPAAPVATAAADAGPVPAASPRPSPTPAAATVAPPPQGTFPTSARPHSRGRRQAQPPGSTQAS